MNVAEAVYCFVLDPGRNRATETQAIDRAHGIGQTRPVIVYRLIARDTIAQKVRALAERKANLRLARRGLGVRNACRASPGSPWFCAPLATSGTRSDRAITAIAKALYRDDFSGTFDSAMAISADPMGWGAFA